MVIKKEICCFFCYVYIDTYKKYIKVKQKKEVKAFDKVFFIAKLLNCKLLAEIVS